VLVIQTENDNDGHHQKTNGHRLRAATRRRTAARTLNT